MKLIEWLKKWNMDSLKINAEILELELTFKDADKAAAWEMYIEMLTRVSTQYLAPEDGDEKTALESVYALFGITRDIIKRHQRDCLEFTKIAIVVLNQVIRPFTAKWHKSAINKAFNNPELCEAFREELRAMQIQLRSYTRMLGDMAGVEEDLTALEKH